MRSVSDRPLAGLEDPATDDLGEVRRWVRIFAELVELNDQLISRAEKESTHTPAAALESRLAVLRESRRFLERRLDFWRGRLWEIRGIDVDWHAGTSSYGARTIHLSRRELELLTFLLDHPATPFSAEALAARAWHDPALAAEQVRSYIVRLRRRLNQLGAPCSIRSRMGAGYSLDFEMPRRATTAAAG
jgi:DNA-binding response OmpR family regulator